MDEERMEALRAEAVRLLPGLGTHGLEHTMRVLRTCRYLGERIGADMSILLPAALLHDIGRGAEAHALEGARLARGILEAAGYGEDEIGAVVNVISTHSFTGGRPPGSPEAMILSDADKLDAMGALGAYRAAMYSVEHERPLEEFVAHFHEKLLRLKRELFTEEARRLADSRHGFMLDFLAQLEKELDLEA